MWFLQITLHKAKLQTASLFFASGQAPFFGHNLCVYVRPPVWGPHIFTNIFVHTLFFCCGFFPKEKMPQRHAAVANSIGNEQKHKYAVHICRSVRYFAHLP